MQLEQAHIRNFRSLRDLTVKFDRYTALIGGNGAGKSSILKAIQKFYDTAKTCEADDFFSRKTDEPIEIELTFHELNEHEAEIFASRVQQGRLVVTRIFDNTANSGRYHGVTLQNPDFVPIRAQVSSNPKREAYRELRQTNPKYESLPPVPAASAVEGALQNWEFEHPEELKLMLDDGQFFGFQNNSRGKLQNYTSFVFVPAVREASTDAADGKNSVIGKLLELVVRSQILQRKDIQEFQRSMTERYQQLVDPQNMPELRILANALTFDIRRLYDDAEVELAWRDVGELPMTLPMADVHLKHDGFGGPVDRQGHGLQRAFVFTILQYLARTTTAQPEPKIEPDEEASKVMPHSPTLILAIEEPELYQHPTKQTHIADVLRRLSDGSLPGVAGTTQVIFCSHSPMFISIGRADEVRVIRRKSIVDGELKHCTLTKIDMVSIAKKLELAHQKPPGTYTAQSLRPRLHILGLELSEGFFANGIVLVEGRSDKAALIAVSRLLNINFAAAGIAVLSAESKNNIDRPLSIFRDLGIPVFVIWDLDQNDRSANNNNINIALLRLLRDDNNLAQLPTTDCVSDNFAHFFNCLEDNIKSEIGTEFYGSAMAKICEQLDIQQGRDAEKIPDVMYDLLLYCEQNGHQLRLMRDIVFAIRKFFSS